MYCIRQDPVGSGCAVPRCVHLHAQSQAYGLDSGASHTSTALTQRHHHPADPPQITRLAAACGCGHSSCSIKSEQLHMSPPRALEEATVHHCCAWPSSRTRKTLSFLKRGCGAPRAQPVLGNGWGRMLWFCGSQGAKNGRKTKYPSNLLPQSAARRRWSIMLIVLMMMMQAPICVMHVWLA